MREIDRDVCMIVDACNHGLRDAVIFVDGVWVTTISSAFVNGKLSQETRDSIIRQFGEKASIQPGRYTLDNLNLSE